MKRFICWSLILFFSLKHKPSYSMAFTQGGLAVEGAMADTLLLQW